MECGHVSGEDSEGPFVPIFYLTYLVINLPFPRSTGDTGTPFRIPLCVRRDPQ